MLRTTKNMKDKYEEIQNLLFDMIPEKWEKIFLYASITDRTGNVQTGELYFYYLPKSILKRKPVNVYEVPAKFNLDEGQYTKLVDSLYENIKDLRQDFIDTDQELWTNVTMSIEKCTFKVEYGYEELKQDEYSNYVRHIIWRYKYLGLGGEIKEERKILDKYFSKPDQETKKQVYQTGIYLKTANNVVVFDKKDVEDEEITKQKINVEKDKTGAQKKYGEIPEEKKKRKNQILKD